MGNSAIENVCIINYVHARMRVCVWCVHACTYVHACTCTFVRDNLCLNWTKEREESLSGKT